MKTPSRAAAYLQYLALRMKQKRPALPASVKLFAPSATVDAVWPMASLYKDIFCLRQYDPPLPIPPGGYILDCGGHMGLASIYLLTKCPTAKVVTFEPNPHSFTKMSANVLRFGSRAVPVQAAVFTSDGTAIFHVTADNLNNVNGGLENRETTSREVITFDVVTHDIRKYLQQTVDFAKIDIEGAEYAILQLPEFNADRVRSMTIEFHDLGKRLDECRSTVEMLTRTRGYRLHNADGFWDRANGLDALLATLSPNAQP